MFFSDVLFLIFKKERKEGEKILKGRCFGERRIVTYMHMFYLTHV